jgi:LuxR family maltose regulon positive regulatory protein
VTAADLPLLGTRFHVPAMRPGQVPRPRLVERLERGALGKLTLLSAPPGFGKTTLLAEWLAGPRAKERDVAWSSLDPADDTPRMFWRYVVAALANVRTAVAECSAAELLEGNQVPEDAVFLTPLLNAIAAQPRDVVLVLDDYHLIESPAVARGMAFLVEHMPPQLHLVLAGRADPALPLPRLRARGDLTEIRAADLRFTPSEADGFLNGSMHLRLAEDDIALLESRTEGWAGALQLAALSLQGRSEPGAFIQDFSGDDRYIVDYLVEEVLERQPPAVRDFLLRTSVLERLCGPLCDFVLGQRDSQAMLEQLERGNLLLQPLDNHRGWFRYHQLFSDVLRVRLLAEAAGAAPGLHRLASEWHAANGDVDIAIRHALAANDFERAAGLIELEAAKTMRLHHPDRLIQWLKPIPDEVVARMPVLSTFYGHALQGMGDMAGSAARIDAAERALQGPPGPTLVSDTSSFGILQALIDVGRGYLAMAARQPEQTARHASRALEVLPANELHWRGTALALLGLAHWHAGELGPAQQLHQDAIACFRQTGDTGLAITSAYHDAELLKARGRLREARRILESTLEFVRSSSVREVRGVANLHIGLSDLSCDTGDYAAAAGHLAAADAAGVYPPRTPFRYKLARAHLLECEGELEGAELLLLEAAPMQVGGAVPDHRPLGPWLARLRAARGRIDDAFAWARERGLTPGDTLRYDREPEHIAFARLLLARGTPADVADARALLERLLAAAEAEDRQGTGIELRVLLAAALRAAGDEAAAVAVLRPALERAEPEGYVHVFTAELHAIGPVLEAAARAGVTPAYCARLVAAAASGPGTPARETSPDALSGREMDVLRLLATDLSGPEISSQLFVSLNTLRTHTKNIYAKLGVTSRRRAVAVATERKLL